MAQPITKLSSYKGPRQTDTYQSKLTEADIEEKLKMYKKIESVDEIAKLPLNTHIRYFSVTKDDKGKKIKKFRLGGFLNNKDNFDKYIILTNKNVSWSVDTKTSILYRKLKDEEIDQNINKEKQQTEVFKDENGKLKDKYDRLEKAYHELVDKYTRLKDKYEKTKTMSVR
jgi:hypothetical protein